MIYFPHFLYEYVNLPFLDKIRADQLKERIPNPQRQVGDQAMLGFWCSFWLQTLIPHSVIVDYHERTADMQ